MPQNRFYTAFDMQEWGSARKADYRSPFQIDRDRIIHAHAFRKLQSKTQVFLSGEYDFYRTRLTHSMEVAQIGRSIVHWLRSRGEPLADDFYLDSDLVEASCLAHDLGHPPFGHSGERTLQELMKRRGGFEGNAQTLHLICETMYQNESGVRGMQPTRALLDGVLKYKKLYTEFATPPINHFIYAPQAPVLQVMKQFGYDVVNNNYESFLINPVKLSTLQTVNYTVEGDWSGAAFLLVAGAISGNIVVTGLDVFSTQADKAILQALMDCGCTLSIEEKQLAISLPAAGIQGLKAFHFDATDCPDLFPPLVALAAYCNGTTTIEGVNRLAHKESNRGLTLQEEFGKMGVTITLQDDLMLVTGGCVVNGAVVHSHHDHRIAMACAVAGLAANGITTIEEAAAINKSYPAFFEDLKKLGASVL